MAAKNAEAQDGNVSSLVATLNEAIFFIQEAQFENSSNPSQAQADLQNATQLADSVSMQAPGIGHEGSIQKSQVMEESLGSTAAIIAVGVLS